MRTYKYKALFERDGDSILWIGRAPNKAEFLNTRVILDLLSDGWKMKKAWKALPETRRPRRSESLAFVDMGQVARF